MKERGKDNEKRRDPTAPPQDHPLAIPPCATAERMLRPNVTASARHAQNHRRCAVACPLPIAAAFATSLLRVAPPCTAMAQSPVAEAAAAAAMQGRLPAPHQPFASPFFNFRKRNREGNGPYESRGHHVLS
ncbi:DNA-binding protein [Sesbania bispinosa]|nr:DNA-binding protein [Sesbania bispinosa]